MKSKQTTKRAALLVIDVQNDFCASDGAVARSGRSVRAIQKAVRTVQGAVLSAREQGMPVVFFRLVYDLHKLPATHAERMKAKKVNNLCAPNSKGIAFFHVLPRPDLGDVVMEKNYYSAFQKTKLNAWLRRRDIDTIVLCGVTTHVCPFLTAADAYYNGYHIVALSDALGTYEGQAWSLRFMKEQFAARVIRVDEF